MWLACDYHVTSMWLSCGSCWHVSTELNISKAQLCVKSADSAPSWWPCPLNYWYLCSIIYRDSCNLFDSRQDEYPASMLIICWTSKDLVYLDGINWFHGSTISRCLILSLPFFFHFFLSSLTPPLNSPPSDRAPPSEASLSTGCTQTPNERTVQWNLPAATTYPPQSD